VNIPAGINTFAPIRLLRLAFGQDSEYYTRYQKVLGLGNMEAHLTHGVRILESASTGIV
jgi:hypothetical protein